MRLIFAFRAFFKAFFNPVEAKDFLSSKPEVKEEKKKEAPVDSSHLRFLALMQHSGRLLDFLQEDITEYSDAQVGAAVREMHRGCQKTLESSVSVRPVFEENEGTVVQIPRGYDPSQVKIVGAVKGDAPYKGRLVHRGWKACTLTLSKTLGEQSSDVLCPAEVEVSE